MEAILSHSSECQAYNFKETTRADLLKTCRGTPAVRKLRQKDHEFETSLSYKKKAPVFKRPNSITNKTYQGSPSSASLALGVDWYSLVFQRSVLPISAFITPWPSASHRCVCVVLPCFYFCAQTSQFAMIPVVFSWSPC